MTLRIVIEYSQVRHNDGKQHWYFFQDLGGLLPKISEIMFICYESQCLRPPCYILEYKMPARPSLIPVKSL